MFKLLFVQLCLVTVALSAAPSPLAAAATQKGVKRDINGNPGTIANLYARDDDIYNGQYPGSTSYAGGYGYYNTYPRTLGVLSPLSYYNNGYNYGYNNYRGLGGYGSGYGLGYNGYRGIGAYNGYGGYGLGYGAGLSSAYPYSYYGSTSYGSYPYSSYGSYPYSGYGGYGYNRYNGLGYSGLDGGLGYGGLNGGLYY